MQHPEMDRITKDLATKSDKIRFLAAAGASKSEIANYLGIRYQFVYNVLKKESSASQPVGRPASVGQGGYSDEPLTIPEAKRRLALTLGVDPSCIKIVVEG